MPDTAPPSKLRIGLRARFIVVISLVLLVVFALTAFVLLHNTRRTLTGNLNDSSKAFAALATRPIGDAYTVYQSFGSLRVKQEINKFTSLNGTISGVGIIGLDGQSTYKLNNATPRSVSSTIASSFDASYVTTASGAITSLVQPYFDTTGQHQFAVVYSVSTAQLEQNIKRQIQTILIFSIMGLVMAAAVTYWLINRLFLRPLESVSDASLAISKGSYSQQVSAERNDEIGDLAKSVNQMATNLKNDILKLQEVDKLKNEFIMITSHNLRTPLTIIEGYIEMVKESQLSESIIKMIGSIEEGLRQLASFSEDILTIASIESGQAKIVTRVSSVGDLVKGIDEMYQAAADQKGLTLDWQLDNASTMINVSATHLRGVLRNLLDNAIKFTGKGGRVSVTTKIVGQDLVLEIADTGIGIAPEEMGKLFVKFHRGTSTLTYNYEGTGIGLYASKLIIQAHHGTITAASTLGKGSTFTVTVPNVVANAEPGIAQTKP